MGRFRRLNSCFLDKEFIDGLNRIMDTISELNALRKKPGTTPEAPVIQEIDSETLPVIKQAQEIVRQAGRGKIFPGGIITDAHA
jgi:hypothetical protein